MTPKEKATELIEKFKDKVNPYIGSGMLSNTHDDSAILWQSKKCAQIVCDEIRRILDGMSKPEYAKFDVYEPKRYTYKGEYDTHLTGYDMENYWNQVTDEINKL